eukprot:1193833-Rhodomonas_salina.2
MQMMTDFGCKAASKDDCVFVYTLQCRGSTLIIATMDDDMIQASDSQELIDHPDGWFHASQTVQIKCMLAKFRVMEDEACLEGFPNPVDTSLSQTDYEILEQDKALQSEDGSVGSAGSLAQAHSLCGCKQCSVADCRVVHRSTGGSVLEHSGAKVAVPVSGGCAASCKGLLLQISARSAFSQFSICAAPSSGTGL